MPQLLHVVEELPAVLLADDPSEQKSQVAYVPAERCLLGAGLGTHQLAEPFLLVVWKPQWSGHRLQIRHAAAKAGISARQSVRTATVLVLISAVSYPAVPSIDFATAR